MLLLLIVIKSKTYFNIKKLLTGVRNKRKDFLVTFSFFIVSNIEHFVAREKELVDIYKKLSSNSTYRIVIFHGLGEISKI